MAAGGDGREDDRAVGIDGGGDDDGFDAAGIGPQRRRGCLDPRDAELGGRGVRRSCVRLDDRDDLDIGAGGEGGEVGAGAPGAEADDGNLDPVG